MKKYITEIVLICFFLIANVGIYLYFDNEINSVKAGQLVAKMEAEEKAKVEADKAKEKAEKDKALAEEKAEKAKADAEKAQAEVERVKADAERKDAEKREKEEKERKKREKKEHNERLGIHKYKAEPQYGVTCSDAEFEARNSGLGKTSYLLVLDSSEEWNVVKKKLNKKYWYFVSYINDGALKRHPNDKTDTINGEIEYCYKVQYTSNHGWVWFDVTNNNAGEDGYTYLPEKAGYIIEYEE